jgi:hypothetical protein
MTLKACVKEAITAQFKQLACTEELSKTTKNLNQNWPGQDSEPASQHLQNTNQKSHHLNQITQHNLLY